MARKSACRATDIADQSTATNNQRRTTTKGNGLRFSTSLLPVPQKITAVPKPMNNENSAPKKTPIPVAFSSLGPDFFREDICANLSGRSEWRNQTLNP